MKFSEILENRKLRLDHARGAIRALSGDERVALLAELLEAEEGAHAPSPEPSAVVHELPLQTKKLRLRSSHSGAAPGPRTLEAHILEILGRRVQPATSHEIYAELDRVRTTTRGTFYSMLGGMVRKGSVVRREPETKNFFGKGAGMYRLAEPS